ARALLWRTYRSHRARPALRRSRAVPPPRAPRPPRPGIGLHRPPPAAVLPGLTGPPAVILGDISDFGFATALRGAAVEGSPAVGSDLYLTTDGGASWHRACF